ncbi:MAG: hypothetical protein AB1765_13255 [Candidatus Hydrogenedentota bacterium]
MEKQYQIRKRFLIKNEIQIPILWFIFFGMLLTYMICGIIIWKLIEELIFVMVNLNPEILNLVISRVADKLIRTFVTFLLLIVFMTLTSIYFSNRIAGPVFRLEEDLKKMIKEKIISKIKIRKNDYLHRLVGILNEFLEKVDFKN